MTSAGQARRRYDVTGRQLQARRNRDRILAVARRLFAEQGYAGTSIAQIAAEAGVSAPTVFAGFTSKVNLLKEALDTAIAGDNEQVPLARRPVLRQVHEAGTAAEVFERLADAFVEVAERAYGMFAAVHGAADSDPQIARLERDVEAQRLAGAGQLAATVADRLGVTDPERIAYIRDAIWILGSPLQYGLLVRERGWSPRQYRDWMARALPALVPPPPD
jgi:AcrR family transcriptional regulator